LNADFLAHCLTTILVVIVLVADCPFETNLEELLVSLTDRELAILFDWDHRTDQGEMVGYQLVSRITDDKL
jgi:hypothetical protein